MAILKTFLCICNTRTGSLICGCYTLVSCVCIFEFQSDTALLYLSIYTVAPSFMSIMRTPSWVETSTVQLDMDKVTCSRTQHLMLAGVEPANSWS